MPSAPDFSVELIHVARARDGEIVHRQLFEGAPDDVPVAALFEDGEGLTAERLDALGIEVDEAFDEALEELADRDAGWVAQTIPVRGGGELMVAARAGHDARAAELLLPGELDSAAELLGAKVLAVAIPSNALLLVTDAGQKWQLVAAFSAAARVQHGAAGEGALWPGVLKAEAGRVTGIIDLRTASLDAVAKRSAP